MAAVLRGAHAAVASFFCGAHAALCPPPVAPRVLVAGVSIGSHRAGTLTTPPGAGGYVRSCPALHSPLFSLLPSSFQAYFLWSGISSASHRAGGDCNEHSVTLLQQQPQEHQQQQEARHESVQRDVSKEVRASALDASPLLTTFKYVCRPVALLLCCRAPFCLNSAAGGVGEGSRLGSRLADWTGVLVGSMPRPYWVGCVFMCCLVAVLPCRVPLCLSSAAGGVGVGSTQSLSADESQFTTDRTLAAAELIRLERMLKTRIATVEAMLKSLQHEREEMGAGRGVSEEKEEGEGEREGRGGKEAEEDDLPSWVDSAGAAAAAGGARGSSVGGSEAGREMVVEEDESEQAVNELHYTVDFTIHPSSTTPLSPTSLPHPTFLLPPPPRLLTLQPLLPLHSSLTHIPSLPTSCPPSPLPHPPHLLAHPHPTQALNTIRNNPSSSPHSPNTTLPPHLSLLLSHLTLSHLPPVCRTDPTTHSPSPISASLFPPPPRLIPWNPHPHRYLLATCTHGRTSNHLLCIRRWVPALSSFGTPLEPLLSPPPSPPLPARMAAPPTTCSAYDGGSPLSLLLEPL
ncbi:unnamed protein product [Closterium sp. Naga37s-1]|nr:unnamed protein product [Closterium sp. Naga37s-1]